MRNPSAKDAKVIDRCFPLVYAVEVSSNKKGMIVGFKSRVVLVVLIVVDSSPSNKSKPINDRVCFQFEVLRGE